MRSQVRMPDQGDPDAGVCRWCGAGKLVTGSGVLVCQCDNANLTLSDGGTRRVGAVVQAYYNNKFPPPLNHG